MRQIRNNDYHTETVFGSISPTRSIFIFLISHCVLNFSSLKKSFGRNRKNTKERESKKI